MVSMPSVPVEASGVLSVVSQLASMCVRWDQNPSKVIYALDRVIQSILRSHMRLHAWYCQGPSRYTSSLTFSAARWPALRDVASLLERSTEPG
jgi:hypothetical protein